MAPGKNPGANSLGWFQGHSISHVANRLAATETACFPQSSGAYPGDSTTPQQPLCSRDLPNRTEALRMRRGESLGGADEEAGRGPTTTRSDGKESLAVKTGEIRGAVKRGLALTRSC